jgi:hypothetical protein
MLQNAHQMLPNVPRMPPKCSLDVAMLTSSFVMPPLRLCPCDAFWNQILARSSYPIAPDRQNNVSNVRAAARERRAAMRPSAATSRRTQPSTRNRTAASARERGRGRGNAGVGPDGGREVSEGPELARRINPDDEETHPHFQTGRAAKDKYDRACVGRSCVIATCDLWKPPKGPPGISPKG